MSCGCVTSNQSCTLSQESLSWTRRMFDLRLSLKTWSTLLVVSLLTGTLAVSGKAWAQSELGSWDNLPEETVFAFRIPNGQQVADVFLNNTKLGAVLFSEKRKNAVLEVLEEDAEGKWSQFRQQLGEYGLETDDLLRLLAGETGYAVSVNFDADPQPFVGGMAWCQPGEELAQKALAALENVVDEQADAEQPVSRIDLQLADQPVMLLKIPSTSEEHQTEFEVDGEYEGLSQEEQRRAVMKAYEEWENSAITVVKYHSVLVCQLGERILVVHNFSGEESPDDSDAADQLSALLARWIEAHESGEGGFTARWADDPSIDRVQALEGLPVMELVGDAASLVRLATSGDNSEQVTQSMVQFFGLEEVGAFALRSTITGSLWQSSYAISIPSPRHGLLKLLDQEPIAPEPPPWVPASVMRYGHIGFDLAEAYQVIKEEVTRQFPERGEGWFQIAEAQIESFTKSSLYDVLGSLGTRHYLISFGLQTDENEEEEDEPQESIAIVWEVEDEPLWSRLMQAMTPFLASTDGAEFQEEQGFRGWRFKQQDKEGGLVVGNSYLVLGYGSGVLESVLASLNNPPTGSDTLRGSELYQSAADMIDLQPGLALEVSDGDRYFTMMHNWLEVQLEKAEFLLDSADESSGSDTFLEAVQTLMPTVEEAKGMLGVIVRQWQVDDDGVHGSAVQELPPP